MRNAPVGVQRVLARLRPAPGSRSSAALTFQRARISFGRAFRPGSEWGPQPVGKRNGSIAAVGLVAAAILVGNLGPTVPVGPTIPLGPTGGTTGAGIEPRLAVGGAVAGIQGVPFRASDGQPATDRSLHFQQVDLVAEPAGPAPDDRLKVEGPFRPDGSLLKPGLVETTVPDGKALIRAYRVRAGDSLTAIAQRFGVSMMTVWWANHLTSKTALFAGQALRIPPVNGVIVTVTASDTLDSLASRHHADAAEILAVNKLRDPVLVAGQTLTIPGARSRAIATPKPKAIVSPTPKAHKKALPATAGTSSRSGRSSRPPATYSGGRFAWPTAGGYISQTFHPGHYGLDIAADSGTRVRAAAGGTVIFAGWKSNGGGYQVWIAHGSGLYTTYNHMSSVAVGRGQRVARGQQVGRVGATGNATGPHLHFEVWRGKIWDGGQRVNPAGYL